MDRVLVQRPDDLRVRVVELDPDDAAHRNGGEIRDRGVRTLDVPRVDLRLQLGSAFEERGVARAEFVDD